MLAIYGSRAKTNSYSKVAGWVNRINHDGATTDTMIIFANAALLLFLPLRKQAPS